MHEPGPGGIAGETAVSPPWLSSLQADLQRLVSQQGSLLHELATCTTSTKQNTACIRTLQTRSEAHGKMHIDVESRIKLEREISELRSRPPSPYTPRGPQTPRGGQGSTTASSTGGRPIDDFQWSSGASRMPNAPSCKQKLGNSCGPQVLKEVYVPYLRSNIAVFS